MDATFEVVLRAIASLIVVVGLIVWLGKRFNGDGSGSAVANLMGPASAKKARGKGFSLSSVFAPKNTKQSNLVNVVSRQALVGRTSISVVDVDGQRLVLGVTDTNISVLHARPLESAAAPQALFDDAAGLGEPSGSDGAFADALQGALKAGDAVTGNAVDGDANDALVAAMPHVHAKPVIVSSSVTEAEGNVVSLSSRMDGSILSPNTWRQAKAAMKVARVGGTKTTNE